MTPEILLSVLIPSIPARLGVLRDLMDRLHSQKDPRMEILVLLDNGTRKIGAKRNILMESAQGRYLCHIDDDDLLSLDFFPTVVNELEHEYDLVAYDAGVSFNGSPEFRVTTMMGVQNEQPCHLPGGGFSDITRTPWLWCCWRTTFARRFRFREDRNWTEDAAWLDLALPEVRTWKKIDRVLFHHRWSKAGTTSAEGA